MSNCTVHKLIEQTEGKSLKHFEGIKTSARDIFKLIQHDIPNAMCFHMGYQDDWSDIKYLPELIKLPYQTCWFEVDVAFLNAGTGRIGFLCTDEGDKIYVSLFKWTEAEKDWGLADFCTLGLDDIPKSIPAVYLSANSATQDASHNELKLLLTYLSYLNCSDNVTRTLHKPDAALQKARAKRGKKPLFSFWTLDIDPQRSQSEGTGWTGEHASPRSHLRRGHARKLPSGLYCWVRACFVQGKTPGFVHKDYAVIH